MKRCPFCAEEIQEAAIKCRFCGERLDREADDAGLGTRNAAREPEPLDIRRIQRTVTIERTGKGLKAGMVVGVLMVLAGLLMAFGGTEDALLGGVSLVVFGFIVIAAIRAGSWWQHG